MLVNKTKLKIIFKPLDWGFYIHKSLIDCVIIKSQVQPLMISTLNLTRFTQRSATLNFVLAVFILSVLLTLAFVVKTAFAEDVVCDPSVNQVGCINNPVQQTSTVTDLFPKAMNIIFVLVGSVTVVMIMVGGIRLIVGSGNSAARTKAKETIIWAVIGLAVTLMSYSIVAIIQGLVK